MGRNGTSGRRALRAAAALVAALVAFGAAGPAIGAGFGPEKLKVGDPAPDFTLQDAKGRPVRLSASAGREVVLLVFWAAGCGACRAEAQHLERLHRAYGDRGLELLAVNIEGLDAARLGERLRDIGLAPSYTILLDPEFAVSDAYTNFIVPVTVVIDRGGVIRYIHTGFEDGTEKEYEKAIQAALGS